MMCECYHTLLCCSNWLVRDRSLEAFRVFAEVSVMGTFPSSHCYCSQMTPHESAIELCVPPSVTDVVVRYLHKVHS